MRRQSLDWQKIAEIFEENFTIHGELGASFSVWQNGEEVFGMAGGFQDRFKTKPWNAHTRVATWSATKGLSAGTLLSVLGSEHIALETPVATLWPEFAQEGKAEITIAQVISHQAGLPGLLDPTISIFDHDAVCQALAAQTPAWVPGSAHGYHTRTLGFLMDEIIRRITSRTLGDMWRTLFGDPLNLDLWIGLPEELISQASSVFPAVLKGSLPQSPFLTAMADPNSLTRMAFSTPAGLSRVSSINDPVARRASLPSMGGVGTAHSLAKWYAMLANGGEFAGTQFFSKDQVAMMSRPLANGFDLIIQEPTAFSCGFMLDARDARGQKISHRYGPSETAFGHPGAGGCLAFADPANGLSFAYVMNMVEMGVFPLQKSLRIVNAIYDEI